MALWGYKVVSVWRNGDLPCALRRTWHVVSGDAPLTMRRGLSPPRGVGVFSCINALIKVEVGFDTKSPEKPDSERGPTVCHITHKDIIGWIRDMLEKWGGMYDA